MNCVSFSLVFFLSLAAKLFNSKLTKLRKKNSIPTILYFSSEPSYAPNKMHMYCKYPMDVRGRECGFVGTLADCITHMGTHT